jgi:predicted ArsR family transcriptional regulator
MKTNTGNDGKVKSPRKTLYAWADKATRGRFKEAAVLREIIHASKGNMQATISQERIAKAIGVTDRTVRTIVKKLVDAGLISVRFQYQKNTKSRLPSIYTLNCVQEAGIPEKFAGTIPEKISTYITTNLSEERISRRLVDIDSEVEEDTAPSTLTPDPWETLPIGNQVRPLADWRVAA